MHIAHHANLFLRRPHKTDGISILEDALLHLLFQRNTAGLFNGGAWLESESGLTYEFLKEHLAMMRRKVAIS